MSSLFPLAMEQIDRARPSFPKDHGQLLVPTGRSIQTQQDVWMELFSDEPTETLATLGSRQRDELEPFNGFTGHWTSDPVGDSAARAQRRV